MTLPPEMAELREAAEATRDYPWLHGGSELVPHAATIIALLDGYAELQRLNDAQADNLRTLLDGYEARGKEVERLTGDLGVADFAVKHQTALKEHAQRSLCGAEAALRKSEERAGKAEEQLKEWQLWAGVNLPQSASITKDGTR